MFKSTAPNSCGGSLGNTDLANFLNSPILSAVSFDGGSGAGHAALINGVNMGTHTYNDTHRRAEFLGAIGGPTSPYNVHYDVTVAAIQTITAATSAGHSAIIAGSGCGLLGGLDFNFFDNYFQTTVLPAVGGTPTSFVIFLMHDVRVLPGQHEQLLHPRVSRRIRLTRADLLPNRLRHHRRYSVLRSQMFRLRRMKLANG